MTHAQIDELSGLKRRIQDLDDEMAATKAEAVVDVKYFSEMKRRRDELARRAAGLEQQVRS